MSLYEQYNLPQAKLVEAS